MDVFALLFIISFLALVITLAVMHIRKHIKTKGNVAKGSKHIGWVSEMLGRDDESTELRNDIKKEVNKTHEKGRNMSKVYILYKEELNSEYEKADVVAVFSSYAAMLLWLKEVWGFESDIEDQDESCVYFSDQHSMHGVQYMLFYQAHDLIGETSHKTGKLVIK